MKLPALLVLSLTTGLPAASVVIDDFSFAQPTYASSSQLGSPRKISTPSVFGNFRRILSTGYLPFTTVDLTTATPSSTGALGPVDFSSVEELLIGLANGNPVGTVQFDSVAFIPEPAPLVLSVLGATLLTVRRRRKKSNVAC